MRDLALGPSGSLPFFGDLCLVRIDPFFCLLHSLGGLAQQSYFKFGETARKRQTTLKSGAQ